MELESVWSGQKGVYVGSGLREMEAYDLRTGSEIVPRALAVERTSEVQDAILELLRQSIPRPFAGCITIPQARGI